ncbi:DNA-processing protein DprA [Pseudonocardia acaciae]|uniref:DNA-processing protein DprA n=1 Tax=Pseudonocardia acaciae TaxID=551276 RepID=UPI000688F4E8|nr:DNA-processing protein DprA [Pseudonocardia acaciae]
MDEVTRLRLALAATRPGVGRGLTKRVHRDGPAALGAVFDGLDHEEQQDIRRRADELGQRGVGALVYGVGGYPRRLACHPDGPVALFYRGPLDLLERPAVGVCGARNVSDQGLRAAAACGEIAAVHGVVSVSGYARGVDMAAHIASLRAGGETVIAIPEGIDHFRVRKEGIGEVWDERRTLVVSQFAPAQPWTVGGAMARNSVIIGLSMALVAVEAGDKGGTLAAGSRALETGRDVWAMQPGGTATGTRVLVERGAVPVDTRADLTARMAGLRHTDDEPGPAPNKGLFDLEVSTSAP